MPLRGLLRLHRLGRRIRRRPRAVWPGAVVESVDAALVFQRMARRVERFVDSTLKVDARGRRYWPATALPPDSVGAAAGQLRRAVPLCTRGVGSIMDLGRTKARPYVARLRRKRVLNFVRHKGIGYRECEGKACGQGRGWFAIRDLPPGCCVLAEKPFASCLDGPDLAMVTWAHACGDDGKHNALHACLAKELLGLAYSSSRLGSRQVSRRRLHGVLVSLHPVVQARPASSRTPRQRRTRPAWRSMETDLEGLWSQMPLISADERERLRSVLKLNAFSFATGDEQLCFSSEYAPLSGVGLFVLGSGFNHSCSPNLSRYSLGDCLVFRTNRHVASGTELTFSYLAPEELRMPRHVRASFLDFKCLCNRCIHESASRASSRRKGCSPEAAKERVLAALRAMQSGRFDEARDLWVTSAVDIARNSTPFDENLVRCATEAALCAVAAGRKGDEHLKVALQAHRGAYAGDSALFCTRLRRELSYDLPAIWFLGSSALQSPGSWERLQDARQWLIKAAAVAPSPVEDWPAMVENICTWPAQLARELREPQ